MEEQIKKEVKNLALKNIEKFIPRDNEIKITDKNFEKYLSNCYLDTTLEREDAFNVELFVTLLVLVIMIICLIGTIFVRIKK